MYNIYYLPEVNKQNKLKIFLLASIFFSVCYSGIASYPLGVINQSIVLGVDDIIPLMPWTIYIYISHYLLVFSGYWLNNNLKITTYTLYGYLLSTIIATIIFIFYPSYIAEQDLNSSVFTNFTRLIYQVLYTIDTPTNSLPSLHTCLALFAANSLQYNKNFGNKAYLWAGLIIISTLTTKQHVILDIIAGILLYFITASFLKRYIET